MADRIPLRALLPAAGLLLLVIGASGQAPPPDKEIQVSSHQFRLPMSIDERRAPLVREVRLFMSADEGKVWEQTASLAPGQNAFQVQVPRDGLFWFQVQVVDNTGRADPADVNSAPALLKVRVDTSKTDPPPPGAPEVVVSAPASSAATTEPPAPARKKGKKRAARQALEPIPAPAQPPAQPTPVPPPPPGFEGPVFSPPVTSVATGVQLPPRFQFKIDPKTPLPDLLPVPPKAQPALGPVDDIAQVAEVAFQEPFKKGTASHLAMAEIAHGIAKINHLNKDKTDGFMVALVRQRADLAGLPFVMGEACRQQEDEARHFNQALSTVRAFLSQPIQVPVAEAEQAPKIAAEFFWDSFRNTTRQADRVRVGPGSVPGRVVDARIAALMQVCGPQSAHMRLGLVKYLSGSARVEATRALAKLAIFSAEDEVRLAAVEALKVRREKDYTDILKQGLRYPLPAVAERTTEAIVQLERTDLADELTALLKEPDPRAPVVKEVDDKAVPVVRELVKINHHRNCLLCHAPGSVVHHKPVLLPSGPRSPSSSSVREGTSRTILVASADTQIPTIPPPAEPRGTAPMSPDIVQGAIPIPGEPMPSVSNGYQSSVPDIVVRVDVTYLRQDFSLMLPVADAHPWPEMQRFDFLVRTRTLSEKEAQTFRERLRPREGSESPYHRFARAALQELTALKADE